ncbi:MAG: ABC transporter permease [Longimicrobiales bacterium]
MRQVFVVLRREYLERVRSKGFLWGTTLVPLIALGLIGVGTFMGSRSQQAQRELAVVDLTGYLGAAVQERLEGAGYDVQLSEQDSIPALTGLVEAGDLYGFLILDQLTLEDGVVVFRGGDEPGAVRAGFLQSLVVQSVLKVRLASGTGPVGDVDELLSGGSFEFEGVGENVDDVSRRAAIATGFVGTMLLYMTMLIYGTYVLRSVLEEKRNRVVEVVISSLRPWQLMLGKILGVGAVGLTQMLIWFGSLALISSLALPTVISRWPALQEAGDLSELLPGPGLILLFMVYFVLGYFLYSALFAAAGAICTGDEEAQQAQMPIVMLLVVPLVLQMGAIEGPGLKWLDWLGLFPFFSPILMFPRAAAGAAPWWMVGLSIVLMIVAIVATAWVAGRIYRVGILMQGKRPTLPEIWRWVRQS